MRLDCSSSGLECDSDSAPKHTRTQILILKRVTLDTLEKSDSDSDSSWDSASDSYADANKTKKCIMCSHLVTCFTKDDDQTSNKLACVTGPQRNDDLCFTSQVV